MDRPALTKLLDDVREGRVDIDQVYGLIARDPSVGLFVLPWSATLPDRSPERELHRLYLEDMASMAGNENPS